MCLFIKNKMLLELSLQKWWTKKFEISALSYYQDHNPPPPPGVVSITEQIEANY